MRPASRGQAWQITAQGSKPWGASAAEGEPLTSHSRRKASSGAPSSTQRGYSAALPASISPTCWQPAPVMRPVISR